MLQPVPPYITRKLYLLSQVVAIPNSNYPVQTPNAGFSKSSEKDLKNKAVSQTTKCATYEFPYTSSTSGEKRTLVFVDTPGFADTAGIQQDEANVHTIIDTASKLPSLAAVIMVINGSVARQTFSEQTVMTRLKGSLPDSVLENLIVVLTNCWKSSSNFQVDSLPFQPKHLLYLNNSAYSQPPSVWKDDPVEVARLEGELQACFGTCKSTLDTIMTLRATSVADFAAMKVSRDEVKQALHDAKLKIQNLQQVMLQIQQVCFFIY